MGGQLQELSIQQLKNIQTNFINRNEDRCDQKLTYEFIFKKMIKFCQFATDKIYIKQYLT